MRLAPLLLISLAACQPALEPGESWAGQEDSFAGIMEVLGQGMRPLTFEIEDPELERRVVEACRDRGYACYPAGTVEPETDMHLKIERVILHRPDVMRLRYTSIHEPRGVWRSSAIILREEGGWKGYGSSRTEGPDYPVFNDREFAGL